MGPREILLPEVVTCKRLYLASSLQCYSTVALPLAVWRRKRLLHLEVGCRFRPTCVVQNRFLAPLFPLHRWLPRPAWVWLQRIRLLLLQRLSEIDHPTTCLKHARQEKLGYFTLWATLWPSRSPAIPRSFLILSDALTPTSFAPSVSKQRSELLYLKQTIICS